MDDISSIEKAWSFANRWWQADALKAAAALDHVVATMEARGGYHSVSHIERMLDKYRQWCEIVRQEPDPRLVTWVFAHDLVYVPGAANNEEDSAIEMGDLLREMGANLRVQKDDRIAIESTKTHQAVDPQDLDDPTIVESIHLLHDLDLEILGSSRSEYNQYRDAVYAEYLAAATDKASFPQAWLQGREAFLRGMLGKDRIFKTPLFAMFERHARDRMREELAQILEELEQKDK